MNRLVCLLAIVATTGCTMSQGSRRTLIGGGAASAIAGALLVNSGSVDADHNGVNDTWLDDDLGAYFLGSMLFIAGVSMFIGGLASQESEETVPPQTELVTRQPIVAPMVAPAEVAPTEVAPTEVAPTLVGPITRPRVITHTPAVQLPEVPTTDEAVLLARKIRSATTYHHCDVAWILWRDLEKLDAAYARALRDGPVMLGCAE